MTDQPREPTQPRIFHIHIDAQQMPQELHRFATHTLGFTDTNFSGHPDGFVHFEPKQHLTLKISSRKEFEAAWRQIEKAADRPDFVGYLEGEYITTDEFIASRPYRDLEVPFQVARRRLSGGDAERFRQTEFHLVYRRDRSDPRLGEKLLRAGLYGAFIPKQDAEYLVLTMQGYLRDIDPLLQKLGNFIEATGGSSGCTLKEERAIRHKLIGIQAASLPEIAGRIDYR